MLKVAIEASGPCAHSTAAVAGPARRRSGDGRRRSGPTRRLARAQVVVAIPRATGSRSGPATRHRSTSARVPNGSRVPCTISGVGVRPAVMRGSKLRGLLGRVERIAEAAAPRSGPRRAARPPRGSRRPPIDLPPMTSGPARPARSRPAMWSQDTLLGAGGRSAPGAGGRPCKKLEARGSQAKGPLPGASAVIDRVIIAAPAPWASSRGSGARRGGPSIRKSASSSRACAQIAQAAGASRPRSESGSSAGSAPRAARPGEIARLKAGREAVDRVGIVRVPRDRLFKIVPVPCPPSALRPRATGLNPASLKPGSSCSARSPCSLATGSPRPRRQLARLPRPPPRRPDRRRGSAGSRAASPEAPPARPARRRRGRVGLLGLKAQQQLAVELAQPSRHAGQPTARARVQPRRSQRPRRRAAAEGAARKRGRQRASTRVAEREGSSRARRHSKSAEQVEVSQAPGRPRDNLGTEQVKAPPVSPLRPAEAAFAETVRPAARSSTDQGGDRSRPPAGASRAGCGRATWLVCRVAGGAVPGAHHLAPPPAGKRLPPTTPMMRRPARLHPCPCGRAAPCPPVRHGAAPASPQSPPSVSGRGAAALGPAICWPEARGQGIHQVDDVAALRVGGDDPA